MFKFHTMNEMHDAGTNTRHDLRWHETLASKNGPFDQAFNTAWGSYQTLGGGTSIETNSAWWTLTSYSKVSDEYRDGLQLEIRDSRGVIRGQKHTTWLKEEFDENWIFKKQWMPPEQESGATRVEEGIWNRVGKVLDNPHAGLNGV